MNGKIERKVLEILPATVKNQLAKMPKEQQDEFIEEFNRKFKPKSTAVAGLMAFFGFHYLYYNKIFLFLLFVCTGGGFGVWWFAVWLRAGKTAREYNQEMAKDIALDVIKEIKILNS